MCGEWERVKEVAERDLVRCGRRRPPERLRHLEVSRGAKKAILRRNLSPKVLRDLRVCRTVHEVLASVKQKIRSACAALTVHDLQCRLIGKFRHMRVVE
jgi:hypothetical protein